MKLEMPDTRSPRDEWLRIRGMVLGRYFIGAFVLAVIAVTFGQKFFYEHPILAAVICPAYVLLVSYAGWLKFHQGE
ncbi:MAG TPA: hypothetical protein VGG60_16115 [Candidatus Binataceae bacterium]|jgi:hypothetical protein